MEKALERFYEVFNPELITPSRDLNDPWLSSPAMKHYYQDVIAKVAAEFNITTKDLDDAIFLDSLPGDGE